MYIRCKNCHDSIWIRPSGDQEFETARCGRCGQRYHLQLAGDFDAARDDLARRASVFARANDVDLPSAYSVLLGIATRDEVSELHAASKQEARRRAGRPTEVPETAPRFDAAFRPAVEAGHLTADEAYRRGKREVYVKRLVERHRLPQELACSVADNRLSLLEALHRRTPGQAVVIRIEPTPARSSRALLICAIVLLTSAVAALHWWQAEELAPSGRSRVRLGTAEVYTDDSGRIVRVVGASPDDVLLTFCRQRPPEARLRATGVMPAVEEHAVRIGVLHPADNPGEVLAIPIREDELTGRWFAGDGLRPLEPKRAPDGALEAIPRR